MRRRVDRLTALVKPPVPAPVPLGPGNRQELMAKSPAVDTGCSDSVKD